MATMARCIRRRLKQGTLLAVLLSAACGPSQVAVPTVGQARGVIPDLRGERVMVLPIQRTTGVGHDADQELEFVLADRGGEVDWVFSSELVRALERAPGVEARVQGLPVSIFLEAEVNRVGDPLYGQLRRMAALVNSELVLLPVRMRYAEVNVEGDLGMELSAVLLDVRTGRVFWYGVVGGQPGAVDDFSTVATAVEALAAQVLWFMR